MTFLKNFWSWPDGFIWRMTRKRTEQSRRARFEIFMRELLPGPADHVLDIGAGEGEGRAVNFFEEWYPWPSQITAVALEDLPAFRAAYPAVKLVVGDGKKLPFPNKAFDIVFSNAVIEHVGTIADQRHFIAEACRVANRVFLSTPNRWFPIDFHTMIPFAHWLPMNMRNAIYRFFHRDYFASEARLRLLGERELLSLIPNNVQARVIRQRVLGWTANINVILERKL